MKGNMRVYYDDEGDYLEIRIGNSGSNYGEDINDNVTIFKDEGTSEIVGIGIFNFRKRSKSNLKDIGLNLPVEIGLFVKDI